MIEAIKDLVKDCEFDCNGSGIQIQTMDSSNVGMVHLVMKETAFEEFNVVVPEEADEEGKQGVTFGLNMESLHKVFKLCGSNDRVTIEFARLENGALDNKVYFTFQPPNEDRLSKFAMNTVNMDCEPMTVPDDGFDVKAIIPSGEFKAAVVELKEFGDELNVQTSKEGITLGSKGEIGHGTVLLKTKTGAKEEESLTIE